MHELLYRPYLMSARLNHTIPVSGLVTVMVLECEWLSKKSTVEFIVTSGLFSQKNLQLVAWLTFFASGARLALETFPAARACCRYDYQLCIMRYFMRLLHHIAVVSYQVVQCGILQTIYSAFANSCPMQTDTFLFPRIYSHNVILSSNEF